MAAAGRGEGLPGLDCTEVSSDSGSDVEIVSVRPPPSPRASTQAQTRPPPRPAGTAAAAGAAPPPSRAAPQCGMPEADAEAAAEAAAEADAEAAAEPMQLDGEPEAAAAAAAGPEAAAEAEAAAVADAMQLDGQPEQLRPQQHASALGHVHQPRAGELEPSGRGAERRRRQQQQQDSESPSFEQCRMEGRVQCQQTPCPMGLAHLQAAAMPPAATAAAAAAGPCPGGRLAACTAANLAEVFVGREDLRPLLAVERLLSGECAAVAAPAAAAAPGGFAGDLCAGFRSFPE